MAQREISSDVDASRARREEEAALVARTLNGDEQAFRVLVERYQRRVYSLAFGVLRHRDDAGDVAQEAFVRAYRNLSRFQGEAAFYTWLYRITYNLSMDALRARARRQRRSVDPDRVLPFCAERSPSCQPAWQAARKELAEVLGNALSRLSDKHRAIIVLREVEGQSYEKMAEVLKISKGTVMSRLFHARRNLQRLLEPYVEGGVKVAPLHLALEGA